MNCAHCGSGISNNTRSGRCKDCRWKGLPKVFKVCSCGRNMSWRSASGTCTVCCLAKVNANHPRYTGDLNPAWKGESVSYYALHQWVRKEWGSANHCEECGLSDPSRIFEWANLSGTYIRAPHDWRMMCRPCHSRHDRNRGPSSRKGYAPRFTERARKYSYAQVAPPAP
jgi:ribosomal protein L31